MWGDGGGKSGDARRQPEVKLLSPARRKLRPNCEMRFRSGPLPARSYRSFAVLDSAALPTSVRTKSVKFDRWRNKNVTARLIC